MAHKRNAAREPRISYRRLALGGAADALATLAYIDARRRKNRRDVKASGGIAANAHLALLPWVVAVRRCQHQHFAAAPATASVAVRATGGGAGGSYRL